MQHVLIERGSTSNTNRLEVTGVLLAQISGQSCGLESKLGMNKIRTRIGEMDRLPYTRHPTPSTPNLTPDTLRSTPCILDPTPDPLLPTPYVLHPAHYILHPAPQKTGGC